MALENRHLQKWQNTFVTLKEKLQKLFQLLINILFTYFRCNILSLQHMDNQYCITNIMRSFKKIAVLVIAKIEKSQIFNFSQNKAPHEELFSP